VPGRLKKDTDMPEAPADVAPVDVAPAAVAPDEAPADVAAAGRSAGLSDAEALARLPRAYRSWVPGVARVTAALLLTVAGGLALRSVPDPAIGTAAAATAREARTARDAREAREARTDGVAGHDPGGAPLTSRPVALPPAPLTTETAETAAMTPVTPDVIPPVTRSAALAGAPGAVVSSRITGRSERPVDLYAVMTSPAGVRVVAATGPIHLHVDVSDGQGGDVAGVDLVWQIRSGSTGAVVFRGHGADVELPVGLLGEGTYQVAVRAVAGVTETTEAGLLVVTAGRA
jgi:hypothetical protein